MHKFCRITGTSKLYKHLLKLARSGYLWPQEEDSHSESSSEEEFVTGEVRSMMDEFQSYLSTRDGGNTKENSTKQHRRQAETVIGPSTGPSTRCSDV